MLFFFFLSWTDAVKQTETEDNTTEFFRRRNAAEKEKKPARDK
jgi:hypothetical protein